MPKIEDIDRIFSEERELFLRKLEDYGTEDVKEMGVTGLITRLMEKVLRAKNLNKLMTENPGVEKHPHFEPLEDVALDVMGYGLILALVLRNQWDGESKNTLSPRTDKPTTRDIIQVMRHSKEHIGILHPQKAGDVGFDLVVSEDTMVPTIGSAPISVPCGFSMKLPEGYWAEIRPRSSTAVKRGILVHQSVMDTGYTGPWFVVCNSLLGKPIKVETGARLAQCILHKASVPDIIEVEALPETERGDTGFGSSGLKA